MHRNLYMIRGDWRVLDYSSQAIEHVMKLQHLIKQTKKSNRRRKTPRQWIYGQFLAKISTNEKTVLSLSSHTPIKCTAEMIMLAVIYSIQQKNTSSKIEQS